MSKSLNTKFWETGDHPVLGFYLPGSGKAPNQKKFFSKKRIVRQKSNWYDKF